MTMQEKARRMREETLEMLRNKPVNSTLTERWFLLEEAWEQVRDLPQPLQEGAGADVYFGARLAAGQRA